MRVSSLMRAWVVVLLVLPFAAANSRGVNSLGAPGIQSFQKASVDDPCFLYFVPGYEECTQVPVSSNVQDLFWIAMSGNSMVQNANPVCWELLDLAWEYGEPDWITGFGANSVWVGAYNYWGMDPAIAYYETGQLLGMIPHEMAHKAGLNEYYAQIFQAGCVVGGPLPSLQ